MGVSKSRHLPPALKDLKKLDPEEFENYKKAFNNGGMSELKRKVDEDIDKWKNVPVNIAVTGNTGVGKSSFINSFRGLRANSEGAAAVGLDETTVEPRKYMHPINKNIALWDLPGVGTQTFPKNTYLQKVCFDKYDYFLIITATRFTENDIWLANEVQKLGKKLFFIRTKMSIDVANDGHDIPGICKDVTVSKVRQAMAKHIKNAGFEGFRVFLIDNHFPLDYDFPDLIETMINEAPIWQQEAMTLTMTNLTKSLIHRKKSALQKRIMIVAIGSAIGGAIPLPGVGLVVDVAIVFGEIRFYRKQLGLDDDSLRENARSLATTVDFLKKDLKLQSHLIGTTVKSIAAFVSTLALSEVAESVTSIAIPIIGSVIGATLSYGSTVAVLRSILNAFVTDALAVNQQLINKMAAPEVDLNQHINIMGISSSQPKQSALENLKSLKKSQFNIAITGTSGVGKSTLVNSLRGLKANDLEAAAVGVDETTVAPMKYIHPYNENIVLWDLPGMGTQRFPESTYLKDFRFDKFDTFLIVTAIRFTENDLRLINEVIRLRKKIFVIRTKINTDVENDQSDNPEICKDDTVCKIRRAMKAHIKNGGFPPIKVFLIDSHFPQGYDFPLLIDALISPFFL